MLQINEQPINDQPVYEDTLRARRKRVRNEDLSQADNVSMEFIVA